MKNKENYGFFEIESVSDSFHKIIIGDNVIEIYGKLQVVQLRQDIFLISACGHNIFVRKDKNGVSFTDFEVSYDCEIEELDEVYDYIRVQPRIEIEDVPYKLTDTLLEKGLIIIRYNKAYYLYDFVLDTLLSKDYEDIEEKDGTLLAYKCLYRPNEYYDGWWVRQNYPFDILVGSLNFDGSLVNNMLESQRWRSFLQLDHDESFVSFLRDYEDTLRQFQESKDSRICAQDGVPTYSYIPYPEFDYRKFLEDKGRV